MTDEEAIEEAIEENWEPWRTQLLCFPTVSNEQGGSASFPVVVCAPTFEQAKTTVQVHVGVVLRKHGIIPEWLKDAE